MGITTTNLTPRIGTQIHADKDTLLKGTAAQEIRRLLTERGVLVYKGVHLDDEEQVVFTKTLGELHGQGIFKVTLDKTQNPEFADYNYGNFSWHIDRTDTDVPPLSSILSPRKLTDVGGNTQFANTYAAYDDLPDSDKKLLHGLKVIHKVGNSFRETIPNPTETQLKNWAKYPPKELPLVWKHRSGRKSLALSTSGREIVGMDKVEGEALLDRLMAWATQPQYVYEHAWDMGDMVMWDNTGTMHKVLMYDFNAGRRMHRTTLVGEEPVAA
jgi:alpha-ketoglutarate-dependent taurine dioxygenase